MLEDMGGDRQSSAEFVSLWLHIVLVCMDELFLPLAVVYSSAWYSLQVFQQVFAFTASVGMCFSLASREMFGTWRLSVFEEENDDEVPFGLCFYFMEQGMDLERIAVVLDCKLALAGAFQKDLTLVRCAASGVVP